MPFETLAPLFLVGTASFLLAWPIARGSAFYRSVLAGIETGRAGMVDGLRGWLALGVLLSHAACMYSFFKDGTWDSGWAGIYGQTGGVGVALFFMVTAYLFWGRVLRKDGQLQVAEFFQSRVRRIVPMYAVSLLIVFIIVAVASGFQLNESPVTLLKQIRPWLTFGFMRDGDINGVRAHHIEAVYWTLAYEWCFYLALPFMALCHRGWKFAALICAVVFFSVSSVIVCFVFGAVAAWIVERNFIPFKLDSHWLTPLPIAALLLAFAYPEIFAWAPAALLFVFFLFVVKDNSLFGLLATSSAKLLGTVSYSIYLLHCIVVFVMVSAANRFVPVSEMSAETYAMLIVAAALLTVLLSTASYRYVEHPFLARTLNKPSAARASAPGRNAARGSMTMPRSPAP